MEILQNTARTVVQPRERMNFPQVELDTLLGKVYLTVQNAKSAHLGTNHEHYLLINTVEYTVSCEFKFGRPQEAPDDSPEIWHRNRSYGLNLRRRRDGYTKSYTDAAFNAIEEKIIPLVCSFLTQNPEMMKRAERVKMNNEIVDREVEIEETQEKLDQLCEDQAKLIDMEKGL